MKMLLKGLRLYGLFLIPLTYINPVARAVCLISWVLLQTPLGPVALAWKPHLRHNPLRKQLRGCLSVDITDIPKLHMFGLWSPKEIRNTFLLIFMHCICQLRVNQKSFFVSAFNWRYMWGPNVVTPYFLKLETLYSGEIWLKPML